MRVRHMVAASVLLALLALSLIIYTTDWAAVGSVLRDAPPLFILLYIIISFTIVMLHTVKWRVVCHAQRIKVPLRRLFAYRTVGFSVSYLTPTMHAGGEPIRAYLLKNEGVSVNKAFSSIIIDRSVEIMMNVLFFFIGALLIINSFDVPANMQVVILSISLILILLMGLFIGGIIGERSMFVAVFRFLRLHKSKRLRPMQRNLAQVERHMEVFFKRKPKHFLLLVLIITLLWVLMFAEYYVALRIIGHHATLMQIFLILTGVGLAYAVPVPAAMGALELGQLSAAKVLDLSSTTGIALAVVVRVRDLLWTILGVLLTAHYHFSFRKLARKQGEIDKDFEQGDLFKERT